jgi:HD-GYP domain-containing protein (c-di-GMP phosphodiesterase class II)
MLKKIPVDRLRLGMYVQQLGGRWIEHSFWKTRFVLDSTDDLRRLRESGMQEIIIDVSKGLDVLEEALPTPALAAAGAAASASASLLATPGRSERPMNEELRQAAAICGRGRDAVTAMFAEARMGRSIDAAGCLPLVDDIARSVQRNPGALVSLARLKTRDDYSYMHSVAVCALMVALGRQIGLGDDDCRTAGLAGLMHDIGKALIPLVVLNKPGRLTDAEFDVVRQHPRHGFELLSEGEGATPEMLDVVLHHHERVDGAGYPDRLPVVQITQLSRMGAICDVYDAITSNRPYKAGWDPADSIARMASWKGQFDETLFAAFVQSLGIYPVGSLVRLESQRLAVVVEQNPHKLISPVVKAFYSLRSQMRITPLRLDLAQPGCSDRIVARESAEAGGFKRLEELWLEPDLLARLPRA